MCLGEGSQIHGGSVRQMSCEVSFDVGMGVHEGSQIQGVAREGCRLRRPLMCVWK